MVDLLRVDGKLFLVHIVSLTAGSAAIQVSRQCVRRELFHSRHVQTKTPPIICYVVFLLPGAVGSPKDCLLKVRSNFAGYAPEHALNGAC